MGVFRSQWSAQNLVMDAWFDQAFGLLFRQRPGIHRHLPSLFGLQLDLCIVEHLVESYFGTAFRWFARHQVMMAQGAPGHDA